CPWLASSHIVATAFITNETYSPPDTRSSVCPKVPVDTFDISWCAMWESISTNCAISIMLFLKIKTS
ncbi:StfH/YfcO family fimbrial adhesin, partial [Salmonella enterica subsp. enterica serovar Kentucky]|nr:StfH/YfcO family fimbrial adhesin [Salmonella enterica subsp. enterica serovar Kentucky]